MTLYLATRHYFGYYALNVLDLEPSVIAVQLGHRDGGRLVEELYGHRDKRKSLAKIRRGLGSRPAGAGLDADQAGDAVRGYESGESASYQRSLRRRYGTCTAVPEAALMLNATIQIRRSVALAGALSAVVASSASARVPDAQPVVTSSPAASHGAAAPTMADIAARREARATQAWRAANPPTIIEVSSPDDGGFDLASAGIGAAVPLMLVLVEVAGRWVLRRHRDHPIRHQLA